MIDFVKSICPDFDKIQEAPILNNTGKEIGWHSIVFLSNREPIGGGTATTKSKARRIAIAELCERMMISKLKKNNPNCCNLQENSTTNGFAFGFEEIPTKLRSVGEAVERWIWSKWIDEHYLMPKKDINIDTLTDLSKQHASYFDQVLYYHMPISIDLEGTSFKLQIGITLGISNDGIFPGSRVCSIDESPWEHALLEAYRHQEIFVNRNNGYFGDCIVYNRIKHFGKNKKSALHQISRAARLNWPKATLKMVEKVNNLPKGTHMWRSLCNDYTQWAFGNEDRFVY